ncbi:MAG: hypothetical protein FD146_67 [Anaerolineaceae bacterium]|nr:MAG: hypothetical protein FD146_67 [Anaerolineaceae bacterium]
MNKANRNHFGGSIEKVSDVVAALNADGVIRYVNPAVTADWRQYHYENPL